MKMSRKLIVFGVMAVGAATFAMVHYFSGLAARTHDQMHQELQKFFAREVRFNRLEARLIGGLGFSAKDFQIADNPRFAATPFVQAKELRLGVSLLQLLAGRVVVDSLTLKEPEFQIITDSEGLINTSAFSIRRKEVTAFPRGKPAGPDRRQAPVNFRVHNITIQNGRVDFIDRSIQEPAEVQVKHVDMELTGLDAAYKTKFRFAAALTEGVGREVRIRGKLGPFQQGRAWSQQPVDLEMEFDSLYVPLLTRALPFLRNRIPRELEISGPSSLQAKMSGTLEYPRITDITLKSPLFGNSDYNAIVTGTVVLPENHSWGEAELKGKLTLDKINLTNLRRLPFLKQNLPVALVTEGPISVFSRFEGSWERLRMGVLVKAQTSELSYGQWLRKPAGSVADLRTRISREKNGLKIHPSVATLGNSQITLSGAIEQRPEPRLRLKLHSERSRLAAWGHLASPLSFYAADGGVDWDVVVERNLSFIGGGWRLWGTLRVADAEFRHKETGKKIERLNAAIVFAGEKARLENVSFRLGSSQIKMAGTVADLAQPRANYELRSPEFNLSDLPPFSVKSSNWVKDMTSTGEIQIQNGAPLLQGYVSSPAGILHATPYSDLKAAVSWAPTGISFKNLSLRLFDGTLECDGFWVSNGEGTQRLEVASQIDSVSVQALVTQRFPQLKEPIKGQLSFRGRFSANARNGTPVQETLTGSGEVEINQGSIGGINLVRRIFSGEQNASGSIKMPLRLPSTLVALADRPDTPFDALKANLTIEQKRLRADGLVLSTPAYSITGSGWIAGDRATKWNGTLILSPQLSQDLQRDYKTIRYFLDGRGRLSIPFRVEGKIPHVQIKPANRALAQVLGWGSSPSSGGERKSANKEQGEWIPKALEKLLNR